MSGLHGNYTWRDCAKMQTQLREEGFHLDIVHIERLWVTYSQDLNAGWLVMPDDPITFMTCVQPFLWSAFNPEHNFFYRPGE